ncbi:MAG: PLP-dependent aminotransferase family protein [Deltaproteobacteria bacterium]|nr:PLP-dependent aminotransferase family protein [Deltaproteobacteria bacterium]
MRYQSDETLGIRLDGASDAPLYLQIAEQLRDRIRAGALPVGTRLPPTRALALALDTHRNTVVRAFELLTAWGLVDGHVGRGSYVATAPRADDAPPLAGAAEPAEPAEPAWRAEIPWNALLSRAALSEPLRRTQRLAGPAAPGAINLASMQPSADLIPHEAMRKCLDHVLRTHGAAALSYAPSQGLERLRALIAAELAGVGVHASPDDILITSGSQQAIDLIARALVNPGDMFLTEGRTYSGALNILTAAGADIIGVPSDAEGPDLAALEPLPGLGQVKGLYLMPSSRNPTGTSISAARREALVAWARRSSVPLLEDDYGADLLLDEATPRLPSLRSLSPDVLHLGTYSKKLMPALRVGFIVCPPALRGPLTTLKHAMDLGTSALLQHALAEFLDRGLLRAHLRTVNAAYRERRDALVDGLRASLPSEATFEVPERGVVLWLSLPPGIDPEAAWQVARLEGVMVSPSTVYATMTPLPPGLRLTYCNEPPERLREGARRLGRALASLGSRGRGRQGTELIGA